MSDPRNRLRQEHPADWSGVDLPTHPDWEFVIDDWGCPAWKTESAAPRIEPNATRAIIRIDDSRTLTEEPDLKAADIEYVLFFIGFGNPIPRHEYPDLPIEGDLSKKATEELIEAISEGHPTSGDPIQYEIEVASTDDPRKLLEIVESILNGKYIITENESLETKFNHGKWTLHIIE